MRTNQTFCIDLIARECRETPAMAFIYAKIIVNQGKHAELPLKEKIKLTDWDWLAEKVKAGQNPLNPSMIYKAGETG